MDPTPCVVLLVRRLSGSQRPLGFQAVVAALSSLRSQAQQHGPAEGAGSNRLDTTPPEELTVATSMSSWKRRERDAARLFNAKRQLLSGSAGWSETTCSDSTAEQTGFQPPPERVP
jgi:hypothetical protein